MATMPAHRLLPDVTTVRRLRNTGWTMKQIADEFGVSTSAVWHKLQREGGLEPRVTYAELIPWHIEPRHMATAIMRNFRLIMKQKNGETLDAHEQKILDKWLQRLEASNAVVNYHPEAPANDASRRGGFYYTTRKPEDKWIVREPPHGLAE